MFKVTEKQRAAILLLTDYETEFVGYGGAAGGGKAQPLTSLVYTPFGSKKMGDVRVGELICHPKGTLTRIIAIHPQGNKDVYEVLFSDGARAECCGNHLWYVNYSRHLSRKTKQELKSGNDGKIQTTLQLIDKLKYNPIIPLTDPIIFNRTSRWELIYQKLDPYVLGILIGDGGLTKSLTFTSADEFIVNEISRLLPNGYTVTKVNNKYAYRIYSGKRNSKGFTVNGLYDLIRQYKLNCKSEHKFIPKELLYAPIDIRFAFAQGLMDSDGTCGTNGHASYSSSSKRLAHEFQYLLRGLGFKVTSVLKKTKRLDSYRLYIQGNNVSKLFRLPRKKDRVVPYLNGQGMVGRKIVSIKKIGVKECQCITVDNPDGLYITDDFIVTHNSYLGCYWLMQLGFYAPKTKYFIGRDSLKDTRESVLQTWRKLSTTIGFNQWKFSDNSIQFSNGSLIDFLDLSFYPQKDPMFERFGSKEYTAGWIEEASQCHPLAFEVLKTRIGRYLNDEYKIKKKILCTFNPRKNWVDATFYRPFKEGKERPDTKFIYALPNDNPFLPTDYIETLRNLKDKATKERLLHGNFDYDDDPNVLISYDKITNSFTNDFVLRGQKYITADIARFGKDSTVVIIWDGWRVVAIHAYTKQSITDTAKAIQILAFQNQIPTSNVLVDEDGVGGGLKDILRCKGFVNNSKPLKGENYDNLKAQCQFHFSDMMNLDKVHVTCTDSAMKDLIIEELQQIKQKNMDGDGKKGVISKDDVKIALGRSPDYMDALTMRSYFDLSYNNIVY